MTGPAVATVTSPGEILALLPELCGFHPVRSLVLLSLRGPRRRVGLTVRVDLPPPEPALEREVAELAAERLHADGASCVVVAVYSDSGRRSRLVGAVRDRCAARDLPVLEALHVGGGAWTSYTCRRPCCPPGGTPLPVDAPALRLVAAERALRGQAVLGSREELVASVAPPADGRADAAARRVADARREAARHLARHGAAAFVERTLAHADALLDVVADGGPVPPRDAARLAVGLQDVRARDLLATRMLARPDELLSLLLGTVREVGPPFDCPAATLLGWAAYARGDGALANVALDRALEADPQYSLALLLRSCLDHGVQPADVRAIVRGTARVLGVPDAPGYRRP